MYKPICDTSKIRFRENCNLPELVEDCVTSVSRPRILQMEKLVTDLLETGAQGGRLADTARDLLACAECTRESTSATTELN